jgi:hypothetical protein
MGCKHGAVAVLLPLHMEELQRVIADYLRTIGYTAVIEDGVVKAMHPRNSAFWVVPMNSGVLFRTLFQKGPNTAAHELDYLRFLAWANRMCIVSRFNDLQNALSVEAWFPSCTTTDVIANFFWRYLADISAPPQMDPQLVERLFPPGNS